MSDEDLAEFIANMKRLREERASTPEGARAVLIEEGYLDQNGEVAELYR
ncbi:hypothetical protein [Granulicella sp. dw_53]|nr:hypothetical protein [Granulicella sp. dw_53]